MRVGAVDNPEDFLWSSYSAYIGASTKPGWLKTDFILSFFNQKSELAHSRYQNFVEDLIGREYENPFRKTVGSAILGTEAFIDEITKKHISEIEPDRNLPALQQFVVRPSLKEIVGAVKSVFSDNEKTVRNASIHICHKYSGLRLRELCQYFSVCESAITEASRRFQVKMEKDKKLREMVSQVKELFKL